MSDHDSIAYLNTISEKLAYNNLIKSYIGDIEYNEATQQPSALIQDREEVTQLTIRRFIDEMAR